MYWKKNSGGRGRKMYEDEGKGQKSPENKGSKEVKEEIFLLLFLDHSLSSFFSSYACLKQGIPLKCWYLHTSLYSVLTVKATVQIFTAIRIISDNIQKTLNQHGFACTCNNKCEVTSYTQMVCVCVCVCARTVSQA